MEHYLLQDEAFQRKVPNLSALNEGDGSYHHILVYGFVLPLKARALFTEKKTRSVLVKRNRK